MLKISFIGNVGQDATTATHDGKQVINFSVAINEQWKDDKGVKKERTTWINCSLWRESKVHEYLKKGTMIHAEGTPTIKSYTDKNNIAQHNLSCNISELTLLTSKTNDDANKTK